MAHVFFLILTDVCDGQPEDECEAELSEVLISQPACNNKRRPEKGQRGTSLCHRQQGLLLAAREIRRHHGAPSRGAVVECDSKRLRWRCARSVRIVRSARKFHKLPEQRGSSLILDSSLPPRRGQKTGDATVFGVFEFVCPPPSRRMSRCTLCTIRRRYRLSLNFFVAERDLRSLFHV